MGNKLLITLALPVLMFSCPVVAEELPGNAIREGSLCNQELIRDAMTGVASKVAMLGCDKPESFKPYVLSMPKGEAGSRLWRELWVVKGCESEYPVKMLFTETGLSGAMWVVED